MEDVCCKFWGTDEHKFNATHLGYKQRGKTNFGTKYFMEVPLAIKTHQRRGAKSGEND